MLDSEYLHNIAVPIGAVAVTPNDSTDLPNIAVKGLYIGTGGALKITTPNGEVATFTAVIAGMFRVQAQRVWATGTTATGIVALF